MKKKLILFCLVLSLFSFVSCKKESNLLHISFPTDTAMSDANRYAVIVDNYISLRDQPGKKGITIGHARKQDVFKVTGIDIFNEDNEQQLWVNIGKGWVLRSSVQLYSSEEKALTNAKNLK